MKKDFVFYYKDENGFTCQQAWSVEIQPIVLFPIDCIVLFLNENKLNFSIRFYFEGEIVVFKLTDKGVSFNLLFVRDSYSIIDETGQVFEFDESENDKVVSCAIEIINRINK